MLPIKELGHKTCTCIFVGLTVTDEDPEGRIIFLSAQPGKEHHELALCPGRDVAPGTKVVNQVSVIV